MLLGKLLLVCMAMLPALGADSSPWGVQSIRQTNIPGSDFLPQVSPQGDIYFAGTEPAATITMENAAGNLVFAVQIPGETEIYAILLGPDGNLYVGGYATPGVFVTTPGAYEASGTGPFLCSLSGQRACLCRKVEHHWRPCLPPGHASGLHRSNCGGWRRKCVRRRIGLPERVIRSILFAETGPRWPATRRCY